jgi:hypothetical protein
LQGNSMDDGLPDLLAIMFLVALALFDGMS